MGPLLVGAAGLMWGARGCCGPWFRRRLRRVAPAAWGDCGAVTAAAALSRLLPEVTLGLVRIEGEWFSAK